MKIRPVGAELFQADRRTDMNQQIVAFRNSANALKIDLYLKQLDIRPINSNPVHNTYVIHRSDRTCLLFPVDKLPKYYY